MTSNKRNRLRRRSAGSLRNPEPGRASAHRHVPMRSRTARARDREENADVRRRAATAKEESSSGTPTRRHVEARRHRQASDPPGRGAERRAQTTGRAGAARGDATEVDEPVRRGMKRQVMEAVVVDAPDERARHLADRREGTTTRACARTSGRAARARRRGRRAVTRPSRELAAEPDVAVGPEQRREVRGQHERVGQGVVIAGTGARAGWRGRELSRARPPFVSGNVKSWRSSSQATSSMPFLHAVVEPRAAEDELPEPVDERLAPDERTASQ